MGPRARLVVSALPACLPAHLARVPLWTWRGSALRPSLDLSRHEGPAPLCLLTCLSRGAPWALGHVCSVPGFSSRGLLRSLFLGQHLLAATQPRGWARCPCPHAYRVLWRHHWSAPGPASPDQSIGGVSSTPAAGCGPSPRPTPASLVARPPWCELLPLPAPPPPASERPPREATLSVCRVLSSGTPRRASVLALRAVGDTCADSTGFQARGREGMRGPCMWSRTCVTGQGPAGAQASLQLPPAAGRRLCLEFSVRGVVSSPAFSLCVVAQRPIPHQSSGAGVPGGSPSVSQFSRSVVSDSLQPHGPQHARPPCPSPTTPGVHPNSCPLSQ